MTKYTCSPNGCRYSPCVIETNPAMPDSFMRLCPVEDEAMWKREKVVTKDQAVLFL